MPTCFICGRKRGKKSMKFKVIGGHQVCGFCQPDVESLDVRLFEVFDKSGKGDRPKKGPFGREKNK